MDTNTIRTVLTDIKMEDTKFLFLRDVEINKNLYDLTIKLKSENAKSLIETETDLNFQIVYIENMIKHSGYDFPLFNEVLKSLRKLDK